MTLYLIRVVSTYRFKCLLPFLLLLSLEVDISVYHSSGGVRDIRDGTRILVCGVRITSWGLFLRASRAWLTVWCVCVCVYKHVYNNTCITVTYIQ